MLKKLIKKLRSKKENSILLNRFDDYLEIFFNPQITLYPRLINEIPWQKILVLTPHADDETLGCGGFLISAVNNNKQVKIVLYSDNRESIPGGNCKEIIEIRSSEFRNAMEITGITDYIELKVSSENFTGSSGLIETTIKYITDYSPDIILLPSLIDNHEEHRILNKILAAALKKINRKIDIALFEVWTPITPNLIFDITPFVERKIEAIKQYRSQIKSINYIDSITGLNRYRSISRLKGNGHCEGFVLLSTEKYVNLVNKYL